MGNPELRCVNISYRLLIFVLFICRPEPFLPFLCAIKRWPKLKSKYQDCVEKVIKYTKTIESWDDLIDPQTLAFYCLGPNPSPYILCNLDIEGKKSKC